MTNVARSGEMASRLADQCGQQFFQIIFPVKIRAVLFEIVIGFFELGPGQQFQEIILRHLDRSRSLIRNKPGHRFSDHEVLVQDQVIYPVRVGERTDIRDGGSGIGHSICANAFNLRF